MNRPVAPGLSRLAAASFGIALTLALVVGTPALADSETATPPDEAVPASRDTSSVTQGFCDFFLTLEDRVDAHGQAVVAEQALEHARRSDAVSEKLRIEALNAKGDTYRKTMDAAEQLLNGTATVDELVDGEDGGDNAVEGDGDASASSSSGKSDDTEKRRSSSPRKRKSTIAFGGEHIEYELGSPADKEAPPFTAAAWVSDGDVTDGQNTYFIGHNPGVFNGVMDLELGDKIAVWDNKGRKRTYYVFDVLTLPNKSNYFRYEGRIAPAGESITLQTCCADNLHVRCVMAR